VTASATALGRARSWLYVPAHRTDLVDKALTGTADAVVLDLEDAVPPQAKDTARAAAVAALEAPRAVPVWVRMNTLDSPWARADTDALASARPDGVRVPKAADVGAVAELAERLAVPVHLLLESALGVESAFLLARCHPLVAGVSLGEADLAADLHVRDRAALRWARQRVVVANRAAGLPSPVAAVWTDLADLDGLAADSIAARDEGFFGRSVIHPSQLEPVHRAFTPAQAEIDSARALLNSLQTAGEHGQSAFVDERGRFVDPAVVAGARWLLDLAPGPDDPAATTAAGRERS
jgi:citrate lyase subunit beta / citryl-CoA lyase